MQELNEKNKLVERRGRYFFALAACARFYGGGYCGAPGALVDDGLLDVLVPKLMLQPLVENAIIHGFEDSDGGEIVVSAREELGRLLITVSDDGRGMSEESLRNFQAQILPGPGRHLGLHNVDAILRLHYGPDNGLRFVPTGGRGTCVRITLPITRREVPSC